MTTLLLWTAVLLPATLLVWLGATYLYSRDPRRRGRALLLIRIFKIRGR